jgi:hypothetical protein
VLSGRGAVLAVVLFSVLIRAADIEARALFVPGGLPGSVRETLGQRLAIVSASALLVDRLMLSAIAAVVTGHYLVAFGQAVVGVTTPALVGDSGPMTIALLWSGSSGGSCARAGRCARIWSLGPLRRRSACSSCSS